MVGMLLVEVVVRFGFQFCRELFEDGGEEGINRFLLRCVAVPDGY